MNLDFWKKVFKYGAYWNWVIAANGIFFSGLALKLMGIEGGPAVELFQAVFFWLVALFGLMYWWVSRDLLGPGSRKFVLLGIIGKLMVFVYFARFYFNDLVSIIALGVATGDLVFALFFIVFLLVAPGEPSA